jgi:hypothetical protein
VLEEPQAAAIQPKTARTLGAVTIERRPRHFPHNCSDDRAPACEQTANILIDFSDAAVVRQNEIL